MAQSQKTFAFPPIVEHEDLTKELTAEEASVSLADFLERSRKAPWMHPDAWLSTDGVRHGPKSGPSGGWVIHHLRRIEAGLRGESLVAETKEELVEKFGEEFVKNAPPGAADKVLRGDDTRVDAVIEETETKFEDEKSKKKREKKERIQREKAEKAGKENQPSNKRKRADWDDSDASFKGESQAGTGANTPYADSMTAYSDTWQKKEDFEQSQEVLVGEVGERDAAPVVKQNGEPPVVVTHDVNGEVVVPSKAKTAEEKAARKLAKKQREKEDKARRESGAAEAQESPAALPATNTSKTEAPQASADGDGKEAKRAAKRAQPESKPMPKRNVLPLSKQSRLAKTTVLPASSEQHLAAKKPAGQAKQEILGKRSKAEELSKQPPAIETNKPSKKRKPPTEQEVKDERPAKKKKKKSSQEAGPKISGKDRNESPVETLNHISMIDRRPKKKAHRKDRTMSKAGGAGD
ncbi:hypothetical protein PRZ48_008518 [Zasmidium cellare]|uniref:Uncharacterized protein n=1 Tax=Zasmidium cellare TaxID=395010 RepID=A0ABR0EFN9_ZASCE|nr:hypothetical protein PRZ48_008518 [Zasmidium cellare]